MTADERNELARIKKAWSDLLDKHEADKLGPIAVALWASLHVDRLIALAESRP